MSELRRALIIANSEYQDRALGGSAASVHDAEELARVLEDPSIGCFSVSRMMSATSSEIARAIDQFFVGSEPGPNDLMLVYFSGICVSDTARLYFAAADTRTADGRIVPSTAVPAGFIDEAMRKCRSRRQAMFFDCRYDGFDGEVRIPGDQPSTSETAFRPFEGRIVLSGVLKGQSGHGARAMSTRQSLFTRFLLRGLKTGEADGNGDGAVDLEELCCYLVEQVRRSTPHQTVSRSGSAEGRIYIGRTATLAPHELPRDLRGALDAPEVPMRLAAVMALEELLRGKDAGFVHAAREALAAKQYTDADARVREAAARGLASAASAQRAADERQSSARPEQHGPGAAAGAGTANSAESAVADPPRDPGTGDSEGSGRRRPGKWIGVWATAALVVATGTWALIRSSPDAAGSLTLPDGTSSASPATNDTPVPSPDPFELLAASPPATRLNHADGLVYVFVPAGKFDMGCSAGDKECDADEPKKTVPVQIPTGFWIGQTKVTQAAWKRINHGRNPSHFKGDQLPVESVTATDADNYCDAAVEGRLPTEREWEYAARGGTTAARYGAIDAIAWYEGNSGDTTHPVGLKQPNAFGLYDMLGNVMEWTSDNRGPDARSVRGGSWNLAASFARASARLRFENAAKLATIGFRCVANFH